MDKATGRSHANKNHEREERLMEMWHDPNHWQEALDEISPADMRRAIREMAKEEAAQEQRAGVRAGAHFDLDKYNSGIGAGVGLEAGERSLDFGPSIQTDGNSTVRPRLHLEPGFARRRTFYPSGNRQVDQQS